MRMARLGKRLSPCHPAHIDDQLDDSTGETWQHLMFSPCLCLIHKSYFPPNPHPWGEGEGGVGRRPCYLLFPLCSFIWLDAFPETCKSMAFFITAIKFAFVPDSPGSWTGKQSFCNSHFTTLSSRSLLRLCLIDLGKKTFQGMSLGCCQDWMLAILIVINIIICPERFLEEH